MLTDFPALQIFLPLLAAPLCVIISRFGRFAWTLSMAVVWAVAVMCASTFASVYMGGEPVTYNMGGWLPPIGIELRIDLLSATMLLLVSMVSAVMMPYFFRSVNEDIAREKQPYFYAAFLLCLSGLLGIISTNDAFNLYVFLELSSLTSYALIAMGRDRRAFSAAFQYLVLGTIGATFILIGVGFLYLLTGTLNISDIALRVDELGPIRPVLAAFAFIAIGLAMKIALFPLHTWLPNAYAHAPSSISAFLAAVGTKVALYAVLRFFYTLFGYDFSFSGMHLALIFTALSVPAIFIGSVVAIFETNLKRMLAFSSIAQMGYITLGIGLATPYGLTASLIHIVNHAVTKGALFLALGCIAYRLGEHVTVDNVRGIGRRMPITAFAFTLAGLSLIGIPLTGGFVSKWYLLMATLNGGWWLLTGMIALSSILALLYIWRVVEALYFGHSHDVPGDVREAPLSMLIPLCILVGVVLFIGIDSTHFVGLTEQITDMLMPATPIEEPFTLEDQL